MVPFSDLKPLERKGDKCWLAISTVGLLIATYCAKSLVFVYSLHGVGSCVLSHSKQKPENITLLPYTTCVILGCYGIATHNTT